MACFPPANTEAIAAIIQKSAPEIRLVVTKDYEENLARVVSGQTDAAALNFHVGAIIAARLYPGQLTPPRKMLDEAPLGIAVRKGQNAELLSGLDAGLAAIRADGTWQRITDRWMGN
jgi:polar amino acid transport system substrate-binding protein